MIYNGVEIPDGVGLILVQRLKDLRKYSPEHDAHHDLGELALAAALYAIPYEARQGNEPLINQDDFINLHIALETGCDFHVEPEPNRLKRMIRAGALLAAEIDRLKALETLPSFEQ